MHCWEKVADLIHDRAVSVFPEGTYHGKDQIESAFRRNFRAIRDEQYAIHNLEWLALAEGMVVCGYKFRRQGTIDGHKRGVGAGRRRFCCASVRDARWNKDLR
jgi:hypothetical protein